MLIHHWDFCGVVSNHLYFTLHCNRLTVQEHRRPTNRLPHLHRTTLQLVIRKRGPPLNIRLHWIPLRILHRRPTDRYHLNTANGPSRRSTDTRVPSSRYRDSRHDWTSGYLDFRAVCCKPDALDRGGAWIRHAGVWSCGYI